MRLEIEVDGGTYWLDVKDHWTQRNRRTWTRAGELHPDDFDSIDSSEAAVRRTNEAKLALLRQWSTGCYLIDDDGKEFHSVDEIALDDLENMDAAFFRFLLNAPLDAWDMRSRLGEPKGRQS